MPGLVLIDGALVAPEAARVSVFDRGFQYGDAVFETLRLYGGVPFALGTHLERLAASAGRIALRLPWSPLELSREVHRLIEAAQLSDAVLKIMVTRGVASGIAPSPDARPALVITLLPLPPLGDVIYERGLSARLVSLRRLPGMLDLQAKTANYLVSILAAGEAKERGDDEAILLDAEGNVAEAASANVFARVDGVWCTPPAGPSLLNGITRRTLLQLCRDAGVPAREQVVTPASLAAADAIVLTSSVREVAPIVRLDGRAVGQGAVPQAARDLLALYRRHARGAP